MGQGHARIRSADIPVCKIHAYEEVDKNVRAPAGVSMNRPITIVGGGLAGLTLGIGLRRCGIPVTIWESGHYPRHRVCGEFISGRGLSVLERLRLHETLLQAGALWARRVAFFLGDRMGPVRTLREPALSVSRFTLDERLAREFQHMGGELKEGASWRNEFSEGVVRATGRRLESATDNQHWFGLKVHAKNVALAADLEMHSLPDGYVGLSRLKGEEVNVCGLFRRAAKRSESLSEPSGPAPLRESGKRSLTWRRTLCGPEGSMLNVRLAEAQFEEASFCSVAGLALQPQLASGESECRIGDALTMTPPVTGNGMSMAFEAAELAVEPLAGYGRGEISWGQAQRAVALSCDCAFSSRLAWAKRLQWIMFAPSIKRAFGSGLLSSGLLWRILLGKTR